MAIAGMIDEKIELWPILRSFGDIAHIGIAPKVWVTLLQSLGEQSLVDANIGKRSEEHTSELQSLMRISYAVFCLQKKNHHILTYQTIYNASLHSNHTIYLS